MSKMEADQIYAVTAYLATIFDVLKDGSEVDVDDRPLFGAMAEKFEVVVDGLDREPTLADVHLFVVANIGRMTAKADPTFTIVTPEGAILTVITAESIQAADEAAQAQGYDVIDYADATMIVARPWPSTRAI